METKMSTGETSKDNLRRNTKIETAQLVSIMSFQEIQEGLRQEMLRAFKSKHITNHANPAPRRIVAADPFILVPVVGGSALMPVQARIDRKRRIVEVSGGHDPATSHYRIFYLSTQKSMFAKI